MAAAGSREEKTWVQNTVFTGKPWEQDVPHAPGNISTGKLLHISGITARLPDGSINGPADMRKQAEQIVQNIKDVCDAAGASIGGIVRLTIYTTDLDAFQEARDAIQGRLYVSPPRGDPGRDFAACVAGHGPRDRTHCGDGRLIPEAVSWMEAGENASSRCRELSVGGPSCIVDCRN